MAPVVDIVIFLLILVSKPTLLSYALLTASNSGGYSPFENHIASREVFPFLVYLTFDEDPEPVKWRCGGSIVSWNRVLTSCQCIIKTNFNQRRDFNRPISIQIITGGTDPSDLQRRVAKQFMLHPKCKQSNGFFFYDLAVLLLPPFHPFTFTTQVRPLLFHGDGRKLEAKQKELAGMGAECFVPSWRAASPAVADGKIPTSHSNKLRVSAKRMMTNKRCEAFLERNSINYPVDGHRLTRNGIICTEKIHPDKNSVSMESGGPLVCQNSVMGVASSVGMSEQDSNGTTHYVEFHTGLQFGLELIKGDQQVQNSSLSSILGMVPIISLFERTVLGCREPNPHSCRASSMKIAGGHNAKEGAFPYVVNLRIVFRDSTFGYCAGAIISKFLVVTACHCLRGNISYVEINAGLIVVTKPNQHRYAYTFEKHPRCRFVSLYYLFDIGAVFISKNDPLIFNHLVQPVPAIGASYGGYYERLLTERMASCFVLGWGLTEEHSTASHLQVAVKQLVTRDDCECLLESAFLNYPEDGNDTNRFVFNGMFCSINKIGGGVEQIGDSGGPVVCLLDDTMRISNDKTPVIVLGIHSGHKTKRMQGTPSLVISTHTGLRNLNGWLSDDLLQEKQHLRILLDAPKSRGTREHFRGLDTFCVFPLSLISCLVCLISRPYDFLRDFAQIPIT